MIAGCIGTLAFEPQKVVRVLPTIVLSICLTIFKQYCSILVHFFFQEQLLTVVYQFYAKLLLEDETFTMETENVPSLLVCVDASMIIHD